MRLNAPSRARIAVLALGVLPGPALADPDWSGRATLLGSYSRGNTENDRIYSDAETTSRSAERRFGISAKYDRRASPEEGVNVTWRGAANYDYFVTERGYAYTRASLEHDSPKDIDRRASAGLGYGSDLLQGEPAALSVRGGVDYVVVKRIEGEDERYPALGWGIKGEYKTQGARLRLFHEQEGYWNLRDTESVSLRSKTGLRVPLVDRLSATVQLNFDWESRPAPGKKATDTTLLFGLEYSWGGPGSS